MELQKAGDQAHDAAFGFFEACWHLKDHIKNDAAVPHTVRQSIENDVKQFEALMVAADIANRSKHLVLERPPRVDAKIAAYHIKAYDGADDREASASYDITLADGSIRDALSVARQAVADWETVFAGHGI